MPKKGWTHFARGKHESRTLTKHLTVYGLEEDSKRYGKSAKRAARESGELILKNTLPFVPKKSGDLRATGRYEVKKSKRGRIVAEVSFGDPPDVDYAYYVHENKPNPPDTKDYTTPGTGPFFLKRGAEASKQKMDQIFAENMRKNVGGFRGRKKS